MDREDLLWNLNQSLEYSKLLNWRILDRPLQFQTYQNDSNPLGSLLCFPRRKLRILE